MCLEAVANTEHILNAKMNVKLAEDIVQDSNLYKSADIINIDDFDSIKCRDIRDHNNFVRVLIGNFSSGK